MTGDKITLPQDWVYATNCIKLLLDHREESARLQLEEAIHELMEIGVDDDDLNDIYNDAVCFEREAEQSDEGKPAMLRYPTMSRQPWESCFPACRATVEHMRKQIESAGGTPPTDRGLYDRWIASELTSQMLVATIKHEYCLALTPEDQLMLIGAARREQKVRAELNDPNSLRSQRAEHGHYH
jgi:hypothetical protein